MIKLCGYYHVGMFTISEMSASSVPLIFKAEHYLKRIRSRHIHYAKGLNLMALVQRNDSLKILYASEDYWRIGQPNNELPC